MNRSLTSLAACAAAVLAAGCGSSSDINYRPKSQLLPRHIQKLAVRPIINKTQQFGLEDKFVLRLRDEFLRDGRYAVLPEAQADGVVLVTISRYILTPTQYDSVLTPIAYKLQVIVDLQFIDRTSNTILWQEPAMEGIHLFGAPTVTGGKTEEQAREFLWDLLSRDIVKRVIQGFGSVTGRSLRSISNQPPPHQKPPILPSKPVNPNPY